MFVDSHCHLSFPELHARLDEIRAEMAAAQVDRALCICTTLEEFDGVQALAAGHDNFWASVGVHPDNEDVLEPSVETLVALSRRDKVVAIGETGLDYYRLNGRSIADMEWQRERFRVHIRAGLERDLPLVIHTRSASEDTVALLKEQGAGRSRGVFHCFTETMAVAREALDLGFLISFSGILTFKSAVELKEVARYVPLDRCLIETDSPYLAPVPYRGKTNSPAYVPYVAKQLAELKGCTVDEVAAHTSRNFEALFRLPRLAAV
ncbi:TatD family hydrolase [Rhizobacter sp. SG703]|uniref:TatD family hydrolase n=1 Tax=Rhizobacter sp. SG703 TaxID=2587140 RepID=UPI001446A67B|nr:TatD family hydrolase [Rhizobacter sp. SG703]NKI92274.1 TatD DNase family protein [Rhizobacter sp. SG703]